MYVILGILAFLVIVAIINDKTKDKHSKTKNSYKDLVYKHYNIEETPLYSTYAQYNGGIPNLYKSGVYDLEVFNNKILLFDNTYNKDFENNIENSTVLYVDKIKNIQLLDKTQIVNNPKLSSLIAFGLIGLAVRNKDKEESYFLNIEYLTSSNKVINFVLGFEITTDLRSYKIITETEKELAYNLYTRINTVLNSIPV